MSPARRRAARALRQVDEVMALEAVLHALEAGSPLRVPQNYAVAVYGTPAGDGAWHRPS